MGEIFKAKVLKIGNSLGVLIPSEIVKQKKIVAGEPLKLSIMNQERKELIKKAFGMARGAKGFHREHEDRTGKF